MSAFPSGRRTIFLTTLEEPVLNALRILVTEGMTSDRAVEIPGTGILARQVDITPASRSVEFLWDSYVAYAVRNESFALPDPIQVPNFDSFRETASSAYLAYVMQTTQATDILDAHLRHWVISCADHVIDVVSTVPPDIRELGASETERRLA